MFLFYHANIQIFYNRWRNYHSAFCLLTLRAMRMMRLVRFRERTSLLVEALETTSRAVSSRGALSAADRARKEKYFYLKIIFDKSYDEISN